MRVLWQFGSLLFKFSPRNFFNYRCCLLKLFGAKIGKNVHIYSTAKIIMPWNLEVKDYSAIGENALIYNLGKVLLCNNVTVSHNAHLCAGTHDYSDPVLPLLKLPIIVQDNAWICADAFIGPGITVNEGAVVGAASVVMKDVEPWTIVAGNPAKHIKDRVLKK